jgi:hypothetical protein
MSYLKTPEKWISHTEILVYGWCEIPVTSWGSSTTVFV